MTRGSAGASPLRAPLPAAVLFDMDGLLVNTEPFWFEAEAVVMARMGVSWAPEDQAVLIGGPMKQAVAYMIERAGGGHDPDEVARSLKHEMEALLALGPIRWMPGARELLVSLLGVGTPRALVSSSARALMRHVLAAVHEDVGPDAFDVTLAGDEVARTKPHPDPYLEAANQLGVDPRDCLVLEDSRTGVTSGLAAGCIVIAVPHATPYSLPIEPADRLHLRRSLEGLEPEHLTTHF